MTLFRTRIGFGHLVRVCAALEYLDGAKPSSLRYMLLYNTVKSGFVDVLHVLAIGDSSRLNQLKLRASKYDVGKTGMMKCSVLLGLDDTSSCSGGNDAV
jgi:hypothetical protein